MSVGKDNNRSTKYRVSGNDDFKNANYHEAMLKYNQALCFAENHHALNQALAYANRSAIYSEIGQYERCLKNIQLAKDHGYPVEKMGKLEEREKTCLLKMESHQCKSADDFHLSHDPNETIPFIAACLQMRDDQKYGRHIVTDKNLKVGDIIAIEPAFVAVPSQRERYLRCYNCFKSEMMNLMPCSHCADVMYCSEKCREEMQKLHEYENHIEGPLKGDIMNFLRVFNKALTACNNSVDELKTFMEQNAERKFSVFDFDLSDPTDPAYGKNRLLAVKSLMAEEDRREQIKKVWSSFNQANKRNFTHFWKINDHQLEFVEHLIIELYSVFLLNTHGMSWYSEPSLRMQLFGGGTGGGRNSFAAGLFPFNSLISHSCAPNCNTINVHGDKMMLYVQQPIKAGEQIFISYGKSFTVTPYVQRQRSLLEEYGFKCTCKACINRYPVEQKSKDRRFKVSTRNPFESIAGARSEWQANNEYVERRFEADFPSREIDDVTERTVFYVGCIASDWMKFKVH